MKPWDSLAAELDRWGAAGRAATFWWRDDDAVAPTAALERLLSLRRGRDVPLALAVIPAGAAPDLPDAVAEAGISVVQHGYEHVDHEAGSAPKSEFGPSRPSAAALHDLAAGRARLRDLFDGRDLPVLVPPWNRMAPSLLAHLPALGYRGVSMFAPRPVPSVGADPPLHAGGSVSRGEMVPGLLRVDTHLDIIDWHGGRGFVGERRALEAMVGHLSARRAGRVAPDEPTGVLTHHLVHDGACHAFLERLLSAIDGHEASQWVAAGELFPPIR